MSVLATETNEMPNLLVGHGGRQSFFSCGNASYCNHFSLQVTDKASVKYVQQRYFCPRVFKCYRKKWKLSNTLHYTSGYDKQCEGQPLNLLAWLNQSILSEYEGHPTLQFILPLNRIIVVYAEMAVLVNIFILAL